MTINVASRNESLFLQPFSQSRIMVGFGSHSLAGIEGCLILGSSRHGQIALSHIDTHYSLMTLSRRIAHLDFQGHQQIKLFARFVIPELGSPDMRPLVHECHVFAVSRVGHKHAPIQGEDAYLCLFLQAIVPMEVIGQRWGNILGRSIQALVAFLRVACLACRSVLLHLRPQGGVGDSHGTCNVTGHLGGKPYFRRISS